MAWQPDGKYYSFAREAIRAHAPAASGVYGLYNFDYQLFIGEAENIRQALLRHLSDDNVRSRRFQPSGFNFKTCPAELRKSNAEALIQIYHPILQSELVSADKISLSLGATAPETSFGVSADKRDFETHEMNSPNDKKSPKIRQRFYFEPAQGVVLAATFVISAGVIFYLGLLAGQNIQKRAKAVLEKPLARMPIVAPLAEPAAIDPGRQSISATAPAKEAVKSRTALVAAKVDVPNASPASSLPSLSAHTSTGDANVGPRNAAATMSKGQAVAPAARAADGGKPWSVQIAASVEKNVADTMAQRLTAKGYESFVVAAEVNGKTWYRVRVGRLTAREDAEKLRQLLDAKEGLHGTYLARD